MTLASNAWVCSICHRKPGVSIEVECPQCESSLVETTPIDFAPSGAASEDHESHLSEELRFIKRIQKEYYEHGAGTFEKYIPQFFKGHIKEHENWAYEKGAASRDAEIRRRIDELNAKAGLIIAGLTTEILLKRQQECEHNYERHWVKAAEAGRMNLLCSGCFKVLNSKFVGISTQHGETIGLKIVTEK